MIKLERQFDAKRLNEFCNHPSIYSWVHGVVQGPMNLTDMISEELPHVNLIGEHGGILFVKHLPCFYEAHVHILPSGRGKWAMGAAIEAMHYMFTHTDAVELWARAPQGNYAVNALIRCLIRDIGGDLQFRSARGWVFNNEVVPARIYTIMAQQWIKRAPGLEAWGEWFQERLDEEYKRLGKPGAQPGNAQYNRHIGAAVEMIRGKQPEKGIAFYNRWARMADYSPITLVHNDPIMINTGEALLELHGKNFFVSELHTYVN